MFSSANANGIAYLALIAFIPLVIVLFRRWPPHVSAVCAMLAADMLLPTAVGFDLPGLPPIGKDFMGVIAVSLALLLWQPQILVRARFGSGAELAGVIMIVGGLGTVLSNGDSVQVGARVLHGVEPLEWVTAAMEDLFRYTLPFFLGRALFRSSRQMRDLLTAMATAGLLYSLILLVELRVSPQFHFWTYGFHPNIFSTVNRWGGYRPMAYFVSGIALAIYMVTTLIAAASLRKAGLPPFPFPRVPLWRTVSGWAVPYLTLIVLFSKSLTSMVWAAGFALAFRLVSTGLLARVAVAGCILVTLYPALRTANLFPYKAIVAVAEAADETRAGSLNYRFENEERMLERARERFLFGWGGYSRGWAWDTDSGEWLSVPDGYWIIQISTAGLLGFLCAYALYVVPVFLAGTQMFRMRSPADRALVVGMMWIVLIRAIDQLPNGFYSSFPLFVAGALQGVLPAVTRPGNGRARRGDEATPAQRWREHVLVEGPPTEKPE